MRRFRKLCQRGSNFDNILSLVDEGRENQNTTISGPTLNADFNGSFLIFRGSGPVLLRNPKFCDFSGVQTHCPHLRIRPCKPRSDHLRNQNISINSYSELAFSAQTFSKFKTTLLLPIIPDTVVIP